MRVWIDITNSPHVLFFRPLIRLLEEDGHEVEVTAREYAQTLELLQLHGIAHHVVGPRHGGAGVARQGARARRAAAGAAPLREAGPVRHRARARLARADAGRAQPRDPQRHRARLRVRDAPAPARAAGGDTRRSSPTRSRPERLARLGAKPPKLVRYPGIKEEYYLADFEPDPAAVDGIDPARVLVVVRTPPEVSLYHRHGNPLFAQVLERLGRDESVHAVVLPRTAEQRGQIRARGLPSLHVPEHAVDAQSLVALADLVVSAGGTMNREAVALGTPVYTTFAGKLGAVDERLIRDGRLRPLARRRRDRAAEARARRGAAASAATRASCSTFFFPHRQE